LRHEGIDAIGSSVNLPHAVLAIHDSRQIGAAIEVDTAPSCLTRCWQSTTATAVDGSICRQHIDSCARLRTLAPRRDSGSRSTALRDYGLHAGREDYAVRPIARAPPS
jgi:hypothetical protein